MGIVADPEGLASAEPEGGAALLGNPAHKGKVSPVRLLPCGRWRATFPSVSGKKMKRPIAPNAWGRRVKA